MEHPSDPNRVPVERRKGRGVLSNRTNRFERLVAEPVDDGWDADEPLPPLRTEVSEERPRKVITRNASPDLHFDRSINPYRGCEHGCVYCFARPTHAYLGLSPGLDFETRLIARPDAPDVLARELANPRYRPATIAIGTNTDPYQPIERERQIMRRILEVLEAFNHPVAVVTKGTLIERDADILGRMGRKGLARVGISVTTLKRGLARSMEPRVPAPERRLRAIRKLTDAGCPVRVMASPLIPALTDHELEGILEAAAKAGAIAASYILLRLPREVAPLFREWLEEACPDRARRIMGRVRDLHGGRDYDPEWGRRLTGAGPFADLVRHRFQIALRRNGLQRDLPPLRTDLFAVPPRQGDQMSLF
ncbi:PA0069 family radical SAM protein [Ovoidimarina sediminis]|uniref:PA0069 family radical SAM protein n=1 Tax=Ovoidimarina sediminis TaxID=3079856 RepID=UPI00290DEA59|nr:PA0069 family radical SAM protein [Rhodophyticola sp. MJ-SS7]MDU8945381.1 PA0069 family radical SAM protein [Rhodophyticola sp. MJ-SS7]